jgi:hypothetical protein
LSQQNPAPKRERERERERETEKREREEGRGRRRIVCEDGLFVRTDRSLAGFELGTYALRALLDGKPRGKEDGWMDGWI